ncbi:hypothetical protein J1614_008618 [Plenodomus biglobosus]|nr:hypothetical protein J1614_008618 [Plenodomus biglobosus]
MFKHELDPYCDANEYLIEEGSDEEEDSGDSEVEEKQPVRNENFGRSFKALFEACLGKIKHDGTFFSLQINDSHINPGLHIRGVGTVGLPLSDRGAQVIANVSKQSPFGKGDATIIDEAVRKTWELDSTEFACRNPSWSSYLATLKGRALQDLGVEVSARAEPYKLLLTT